MQVQHQEHTASLPQAASATTGEWFALLTKPRHEKRVASELEEKEVDVFLPLYSAIHQWSDRRQEVQLPLFPNYVFVRLDGNRTGRVTVLRTNGVRSFVGMRGAGVQVPHEEIEAVRRILAERIQFTNYPFLTVGQKVRVRGGSLDGVCGVLTAVNNDRSLVVSVDCIQRSLAIRIDGYGVDPV
jgi:transcription antitermination factor NusG